MRAFMISLTFLTACGPSSATPEDDAGTHNDAAVDANLVDADPLAPDAALIDAALGAPDAMVATIDAQAAPVDAMVAAPDAAPPPPFVWGGTYLVNVVKTSTDCVGGGMIVTWNKATIDPPTGPNPFIMFYRLGDIDPNNSGWIAQNALDHLDISMFGPQPGACGITTNWSIYRVGSSSFAWTGNFEIHCANQAPPGQNFCTDKFTVTSTARL